MRSLDEWKILFERKKEEKLSVKEFCDKYSINRTTYYYHRKRINQQKLEMIRVSSKEKETIINKISFFLNDKRIEITYSSNSELRNILEVIKNV